MEETDALSRQEPQRKARGKRFSLALAPVQLQCAVDYRSKKRCMMDAEGTREGTMGPKHQNSGRALEERNGEDRQRARAGLRTSPNATLFRLYGWLGWLGWV